MSYTLLKRLLDLIGATLLLAALLPVWGVVALALLAVEGRPIVFRQRRAGRGGVPFDLLKFRTMRDGPPPTLYDRPVGRPQDDPRVHSVGRFLRRTGLDETPQVINVLRGEMSMVGPRPLPVADLEHPGWLNKVNDAERARREEWAARRQEVTPGLAGLWQISAAPESDFENWIVCDLAYVAHRSFWLDIWILLQEPWAIIRGRRNENNQS
jgi:lipopolysaccharide/colanic/teichoic acid biosynthesis glycosyltransferase